jgi:hypothetical protein
MNPRIFAKSRLSDGIEMPCAASIPPKQINWIWYGYLAAGKFHILAGPAGTGKTSVALDMAATISNGGFGGRQWPDKAFAPKGNVIIWSGEDGVEDTIVPRLIAAGADMSRIFILRGTVEHGRSRSFNFANDIPALILEIEKIGTVSLVIIDSIVQAVAGDSNKNSDVRHALTPLTELGEHHHCAILGITHLSKGSKKKDPLDRVTGSLAFAATARVVMITAKVCVGAHLLPAMSKRHRVRMLWIACLVVTILSQLSFFTDVSHADGEYRAMNSVQAVNARRQIESAKEALGRITARPVAVVARNLSKSTNAKRTAALEVELDEAKRAAKLQDTLITLENIAANIQSNESNAPLLSLFETATGNNAAVTTIILGVMRALVFELLGVFFWYELLKPQPEVESQIAGSSASRELPVPEVPSSVEDKQLATLKHAINAGKVKPTVAAIRKFMQCSQDKASSLRKSLVHPKQLSGDCGAGFRELRSQVQ